MAPTVSSIVFKTFRFNAERGREVQYQDFILESSIRDAGDGWHYRKTHEFWEELSFGSTIIPLGILQNEDLVETTTHTDLSIPAVFKVQLVKLKKTSKQLTNLRVMEKIFQRQESEL